MKLKPIVLFATPVLHHPPVGGPTLRIENSIKALSQISDLYIYCRIPPGAIGGTKAVSYYQQYCKNFYFSFALSSKFSQFIQKAINFIQRAANFLSRRILQLEIFKPRSNTKEDFQDLISLADNIKADVIWLGYGNISYPLLKYIKQHSNYKVVLDTDSVWSRFILRELPFIENAEKYEQTYKSGQEKVEEESWGTRLADVTTAVSQVDAGYYSNLAGRKQQIHVFSNVIDPASYQPMSPIDNLKKPSIYLAGSFYADRCPMSDAARWVISDILPLVRQQIPDIHFYIVGTGSDKVLSDIHDPGITITGQVPSVLPYLYHIDVALVPLRFESGTRFKILEAGVCGIPVVSTTLGAEGIPVVHEKDILIADDPEAFACSIIRLIKDRELANKMTKNLRDLVQEKFSISSLVREGSDILKYLNLIDTSHN
jgi:glycosyltransferase involved in cell wall biosynthesis